LINPQGVEFKQIFPCFEHATLTDLLDRQGVSWRYYGVSGGSWPTSAPNGIWTAPNSIKHICVAVGQKCTGKEWTSKVEFQQSAVLSEISNCKLPGVSWVIPDAADSDHSFAVTFTGGPSWVASIVNAVGTSKCKNPDGSSYWDSTAKRGRHVGACANQFIVYRNRIGDAGQAAAFRLPQPTKSEPSVW
jgi:hypothetical protein